jgi:hypothetical protein
METDSQGLRALSERRLGQGFDVQLKHEILCGRLGLTQDEPSRLRGLGVV